MCYIEELEDIYVLSIDELQSSLIIHEHKFQRRNGEEQAMKGTYEIGTGRGRTNFIKATIECYQCHQLGHFHYKYSWNKEANYAEINEETKML